MNYYLQVYKLSNVNIIDSITFLEKWKLKRVYKIEERNGLEDQYVTPNIQLKVLIMIVYLLTRLVYYVISDTNCIQHLFLSSVAKRPSNNEVLQISF